MLTDELRKKVGATPINYFKNSLKGKTFSILGDSTSTGGKLAWSYATNSYKTWDIKNWWEYLVSDAEMKLFVNNSWGGRRLTVVDDFDSSDRYHKDGTEEGAAGCHVRELRVLGSWSGSDGWSSGHLIQAPDYIIIKLGINDFNGGTSRDLKSDGTYTAAFAQEAELGDYYGSYPIEQIFNSDYLDINYNHKFAIKEKTDPLLRNFSYAYALTIARLQRMYPGTRIFLCTIPPFDANEVSGRYPERNDGTRKGNNYSFLADSIVNFNNRIRQLGVAFSCGIIEHAMCGITYNNFDEYMKDNLHQNAEGAKLMGEEAIRALAYS